VKKARTGKKSSGRISGPALTPAQRRARDLAKAKQYLVKAKAYRVIAVEEEKLGHKTTAAHDLAKARKDIAKAAKYKLKALQVGYARPPARQPGGQWVTAWNGQWPTCAAAAVANSLLVATGWRVSDDDVLALHTAAGGTADTGPVMVDVLYELLACGVAGVRPRSVTAVDRPRAGDVAVVLAPSWEPHAVALTDDGPVSWGTVLPAALLGYACEVWEVTW
jgi:hypothetical protein